MNKEDIFKYIRYDDINQVKKWLELYPNDINVKNDIGITLLHNACKYINLQIVKLLIEKGANIHYKDNRGQTALHLACYWNSQLNIAKYLIKKGADVNSKNDYGNTPLHNASYYGRLEIAKLLIDKGADINYKDNEDKIPLHNACYWNNQLDIAKYLIEKGADFNCKDKYGYTPVDYLNDENRNIINKYIRYIKLDSKITSLNQIKL